MINVNRSFHFLKTIKKKLTHNTQARALGKMVLRSLKESLTEKVNPINSIRKKNTEGKSRKVNQRRNGSKKQW